MEILQVFSEIRKHGWADIWSLCCALILYYTYTEYPTMEPKKPRLLVRLFPSLFPGLLWTSPLSLLSFFAELLFRFPSVDTEWIASTHLEAVLSLRSKSRTVEENKWFESPRRKPPAEISWKSMDRIPTFLSRHENDLIWDITYTGPKPYILLKRFVPARRTTSLLPLFF
jgi:hypothetical protein